MRKSIKVNPVSRTNLAPSRPAAPLTKAKAQPAPANTTEGPPLAKATQDLPRASHRGEVRIGTVTYECFILDGGTRVLSQRTTLKALGATENTHDSILKKSDKKGAVKLVDSGAENEKNSNDSGRLTGAAKLRFHPPEGNTVIVGYTVYQVLDLLRDWQGRLVRGELRENQRHIGVKASETLAALAGVGLEAMVDDACGYAPNESRSAGFDRWLRHTRNLDVTRLLRVELMVEASRLYGQPYKPGERPPTFMKQFAGSLYKTILGDSQYERFKEVCDAAKGPDEVRNQMYQFLSKIGLDYVRDVLIVAEAYAKTSRTPAAFWNKLRTYTQGQMYQYELDI